MSALTLQIDATFRTQVARGQWRFGRYAFLLKTHALFPEGFTKTWLFGMSSLHASTLVPVDPTAALWEARFPGTYKIQKPNKTQNWFLLRWWTTACDGFAPTHFVSLPQSSATYLLFSKFNRLNFFFFFFGFLKYNYQVFWIEDFSRSTEFGSNTLRSTGIINFCLLVCFRPRPPISLSRAYTKSDWLLCGRSCGS